MSKRIAILQSNYIPWKGYFDLIASVDAFVLLDEVQFTKNDWRNRNRIKTPSGVQWMSIPVGPAIHRTIREVEVGDDRWRSTHWRTLTANYRRTPCFDQIAPWLEPLYVGERERGLSKINRAFIDAVCRHLRIATPISWSWDYALPDEREARLLALCRMLDATTYVSGPAARAYLDEAAFARQGVSVEWFDYAGYPEYPQPWGEFRHDVTVLDLLFNCGADAPQYMKFAGR